MNTVIPEKNKKPGVRYAVTDAGIELPVIDITHPAFACEVNEEYVSALIDDAVKGIELMKTMPPEVRKSIMESSILARGWVQASGGIMTGLITYLNRLGPDHLGDGYAGPADRRIAAGLMPTSFRLRLRMVARLLADGLAGTAEKSPGAPMHLLNIGGGPSADSLNALILIRKEHPGLLEDRRIAIHVLDPDSEGPNFGARSLAVLLEHGAALQGLAITFEHVAYDWVDPSVLKTVLEAMEGDAVAAGSTEGALFDYGSDEVIVSNLSTMREYVPEGFVMVGSVVRDNNTLDPRMPRMEGAAGMPVIRYLGLEALSVLAQQAGWTVDATLDSFAHHAVRLRKR